MSVTSTAQTRLNNVKRIGAGAGLKIVLKYALP
jgi:hypothetical protein